jgi:hypothetical protein
MNIIKPSTWAPSLEQAWTCVSHLQARDSNKLCHLSGVLPPGLVWGGLAVLPRGPPNPPNIAQMRPFLYMTQFRVGGRSHVPAISLCSSDGNGTHTTGTLTFFRFVELKIFCTKLNQKKQDHL